MTREKLIYDMPNMGCLVGTAYQVLLANLTAELDAAGLGITAAEYMVLRVLYEREGVQQCEIAEILGKDKATVCRGISGMVAKGLVRTEAISHKCQRVFLTERGLALKDAVMEVATKRDRALASLCAPSDMETFAKVLKLIIHNK